MEFKAEQKYLLISPRKVRPVVAMIKKLTPSRALEVLPFIKRKGSEVLSKVIKSAIANASQKGVDVKKLTFKEIQIGEGPRLKRGQPVSRGRWHPIKKRMSHIKVILETVEVKQLSKKDDKKENKNKNKNKNKKEEVIEKLKSKIVKTKVIEKGDKNGTKN